MDDMRRLIEHSDSRTIAQAAELLNWPTHGEFACALWQWSCCVRIDYSSASDIMRQAGYIPFVGYPLARSGRLPRLTDHAEYERLYADNPIVQLAEQSKVT